MSDVSFKDIILILWKYKIVIAVITVVCMLVGLSYCLFINTKAYEAESVILIQPVDNKSNIANIDTVTEVVDYLTTNPSFSLESYIAQIKLTPVIENVADELGIDKSDSRYIKTLKNSISVSSPNNSNLIFISYVDSEAERAVLGANAVADSYIDYVSDTIKLQATTAIEFITSQYEIEKANEAKALEELTEFLSQPRGVSEVQDELQSSISLISSYKTQIAELEIEIAYYEEGLITAKKQLNETPEFFIAAKAVGEDSAVIGALLSDGEYNLSEIVEFTMVEQIPNEAYIELLNIINEYEIKLQMDKAKYTALGNSLVKHQAEIENLQSELAIKTAQSDSLYQKVDDAKESIELYQEEKKIAETKLVADIGKRSVHKVSNAVDYKSVGISNLIILIFSTAFGLILGILTAFIINAWKSDEKSSKEKELAQT
jgi:uncharacterized protein involved in exopolysaccharide biosynthesis